MRTSRDASNRATSFRNAERNHLGTPSEIKSEWCARSSRKPGRLPSESAREGVLLSPKHVILMSVFKGEDVQLEASKNLALLDGS
jgi:hypothetical protein